MHPNSKRLGDYFVTKYLKDRGAGLSVLEVGSADINGSVRELFKDCNYLGIDVCKYKGVDHVLSKPYNYPYADKTFDVVISTNTLEHCDHPWITFKEMCRVLKQGGLICNIVPWRIHIHREGHPPKDCWRILDDGMKVLMTDNDLEIIECRIQEDDTIGIGRKK